MKKSRKLLSTLLALAMAISLFAAMPLTASAATTHTASNAAELGTALASAESGDTIKLLADVTYPSTIIIDSAKTITFDLNGKTLSATSGVYAEYGGKILLANPANGQFNVSGKSEVGSHTVCSVGARIEVTSISTSVNGIDAVYASSTGSVIVVYGNITHIGASGRGVYATDKAEITVSGKITVSPGVTYARVGGSDKTKMQFEATTSKPGYLEYIDSSGSTNSFFWLRQHPPFQVTLHPVGATYAQNDPAAPLKATFEYDAMEPYGQVQDSATEAPIKVTWYWSATDSNTGRSNALDEEPVVHNRQITHTATFTPKTDTVGVRYYYAVLTYKEEVTNMVPSGSPTAGLIMVEQKTYVNREAMSDTARIEVTAPAPAGGEHKFQVKKVDENGNLLSGAVIALVPNSDHQQDASVKSHEATTVNGNAEFSVTEGYYILSEKQAPAGFNAADDKYYINVTPNGVFIYTPGSNVSKPYEIVTFVNKPIPGLNKTDHIAFMMGYPDGTFGPSKNMTRAEAVAMFSRLLKEKSDESVNYYRSEYYPDVPATAWYANQVCYMHSKGVLADYSRDGRFRPNESVTRAEFATLAAHFDNLALTETNVFTDVSGAHWAVKYINSAAAKGWITGYADGTFKPEAYITRAEVVTLVNRMLERSADSDYLAANASTLPRKFSDLTSAHWAYLAIMEAAIGHDYIKDNSGKENWTAVY